MSAWTIVRRAVSIAGRVTDALSGLPLAGALVEISGGPSAFLARREILARDPAWARQARRLDRQVSRPDGLYAFAGLPPGSYQLRVSAPGAGTRYGTASLPAVLVADARDAGGRIRLAPADAALAPTRISGSVLRGDTTPAKPAAGARVRLRGEGLTVHADDDGRFTLAALPAGRSTLEVVAQGYRTLTQVVTLTAGQEQTINSLVLAAGP